MDWLQSTYLFIGSLTASTLSSIAGGGAGLLQFPLLIFLGLSFQTALATHKIATVAMGLGAAISHLRAKQFDLKLAVYLIVTGCLGVVAGAYVVLILPGKIGELLLGFIILSLGIYSRFKKELGHQERPSHRDPLGWVIGGVVLFLLGIFNGSLTAGSGLVVTLFLVRWFGFSYKQAVALTLVCVGLFWNGMGAIAIVNVGIAPHWAWVPILLVSSFLGGWLGAIATHRLPNSVIKIAFEVLTIMVSIKLIYSAW
ncbi:putative permease [Vibrio nigripulchritudo SO65]|uniref:sulfite exporter TauE/SafE family protein n=1 Tax=Vibrio nigripulchritudo TaxID=28173 RepID=UPI0003B21665|nr:sulfite exporter TauE/SafE family protein [Vibrio nigripulchritudo]CCN36274.1 putative permease [Vibrio nigripulchritudo AM115]CCN39833.1 putative permease [Vibrio nigripulchritudo FTn2]CCN65649.1 putative permease [Vibrio nigripulchritudo POn4]CCN74112.1 putative permease [Vibrio nigripulchritudo SO65]